MAFWLLKLLSIDMKEKTENKISRTNKETQKITKNKSNGK